LTALTIGVGPSDGRVADLHVAVAAINVVKDAQFAREMPVAGLLQVRAISVREGQSILVSGKIQCSTTTLIAGKSEEDSFVSCG